MNQIPRPVVALPADRNGGQVAADATRTSEFEANLEKYEHLEELTELFFAAKRHHPVHLSSVHT